MDGPQLHNESPSFAQRADRPGLGSRVLGLRVVYDLGLGSRVLGSGWFRIYV